MTKIYLIRHGEAEGNLYRRVQGSWNSHLTQRGWQQVDALEKRFENIHIDAVYASDLSRARETATAIARSRDMEIRTDPRLREQCMGVWESKPWGVLEQSFPDEMAVFYSDPAAWRVLGSERFEDVQTRMLAAIREIARRHEGGSVAAVSHGMAIKAFIYAAMGYPSTDETAAKLHGDNTSVTVLEVERDVITVERIFDNSHLGDALSTFARQKQWKKAGSFDSTALHYINLDPKEKADADIYLRAYADSWRAAHGSDKGFVPGAYISTARCHAAISPECLVKVMCGDEVAGVIELDPRRGREDGLGWISLLCLNSEYRNKGLGVQLLGYAFSYFEERRRTAVRLHAAVTNERALRFYKRCGFSEVRIDSGVSSDQVLMERPL